MKWTKLALGYAYVTKAQPLTVDSNSGNPTLYVYGDSVSDSGFTYSMTNGAWPQPFYDKRFSNGQVWVEYMAESYGFNLYNLARGGATSNSSLVLGMTGPGVSWPVIAAAEQIEQNMIVLSQATEDTETGTSSKNTSADIHLLCAGANDFFFMPLKVGYAEYISNMDKYINESVIAIADATRYLMDDDSVQNVAVCDSYPLYKVPYVLDQGAAFTSIIKLATDKFAKQVTFDVQEMAKKYPDKTLVIAPLLSVMLEILPTFENSTEGCLNFTSTFDATQCCNPADYSFWDQMHPTTEAHKKLADGLGPLIFTKQT
eukprot:CFRG0674T1